MKVVNGNLFDFWNAGEWIVITTNGNVKKNGRAVMGKGVALEASQKCPNLSKILGEYIQEGGNQVYFFPEYKIITFPTKNNWKNDSLINLIELSAHDLLIGVNNSHFFADKIERVYMPKPGCGNGNLDWKDVEPILDSYLDKRFIICEK